MLNRIASGQRGAPAGSASATQVSLVRLIARPEPYHGKRVRVSGFLHQKFEDSALYLSKADADHLITANAIWVRYDPKVQLEPEEGSAKDLDYFDGRPVMLEGIFNMNQHGHRGAFSGVLERVVRVLEESRTYDGRERFKGSNKQGALPKRNPR
jgi:hypothetical protein